MPAKEGEDYIKSETGNWNVASYYSKMKIMAPLATCDFYEDIAAFGYESLAEELISYRVPQDLIRIKALKRLIRELIKVINNSKFAMKKANTKTEILKYKNQLKQLGKTVPKLYEITQDHIKKTSIVKIKDYEVFDKFLEIVIEIKSKINEPLNKNHLIFIDKEEFDPKAFKDNLKRRMTHQG